MAGESQDQQQSGAEGSFIANNFAYALGLKDMIEMLSTAYHELRQTNQRLEMLFAKPQMATTALSLDEFLERVWKGGPMHTNRVLLYSIYGSQMISLKAAANKRDEFIGHLNMMMVNLTQKLKENAINCCLYYSTEEELFNTLLKVFHLKLFESPIFRKVLLRAYPLADLQRGLENHNRL